MKSSLSKLQAILAYLHQLDPEFTMPNLSTFLTVAENDGITMDKLADAAGYGRSSATRNIFVLSKFGEGKRAGMNLVYQDFMGEDRRQKTVHLTEKGKKVLLTINQLLA